MPKKPRIAIVLPGIQYGGGVPTMALFLYQAIQESFTYEADLISIAMSSRNEWSTRILSPASWRKGVQISSGSWRSVPVTFVGAQWVELEWQRYRPRVVLDELLSRYDLVQVVAGTPAPALVTKNIKQPTCLYVATTAEQDRFSRISQSTGVRAILSRFMTSLSNRMEPAALNQMDHVFALSPYTYAQLDKYLPDNKLSLALPGIDSKLFFPAEKYQVDGPIICVGRLADPRKNSRMLLEAYHLLRESLVDAPRLLLVGEYPSREDWELAKAWGLTPYIDVQENLTPQELAPLYRQASLFVLTSNEEGLGIVIPEAMACGLPVIATRCGGPEAAVVEDETGYLIPVGDVNTLTMRMTQLWQEPALRSRMGQRGCERVIDHFSIAATSRIFFEQYEALLRTS
ncbi:MAG: glycosyltransferase family 4 protein [Anaerolineae bacterium]|nr:glycosyltransferase family 4 protein [Anaerolineae bacterium]